MLIVADENIPLLDAFFGSWGEIRRLPGRSIQSADLAAADLLLVRSVTRVNSGLLGSARPRFVGSATIGTDHIDVGWLAEQGIPFAAAPGCNARAVGEYVATVLALFAARDSCPLKGMRLGIVGFGNVGREVLVLARAFDMEVSVCDPLAPVSSLPDDVPHMSLDALGDWADVLTLHVPLTHSGSHPTFHLLDSRRLSAGRWRLLINTARGGVVDNTALTAILGGRGDRLAVLDVWETEPAVPVGLLDKVWLGTPHVAGYSAEGKWRGTEQVYRAACRALGREPEITLSAILAQRGDVAGDVLWPGTLAGLLATCCPVEDDFRRLRAAVGDGQVPAAAFDALRGGYPERREFAHWRVHGTGISLGLKAETTTPQLTAALLRGLGFCSAD